MLSTIATRKMLEEHMNEYIDMMENGEEIIFLGQDYKEIGRFLPRGKSVRLAAERVMGILRGDIDIEQIKEEALRRKYALND